MKKHLLALSAAAVLLAPQAVGAEGFSINEWSAEGFAMGGARMFAENDAANMAYNPASMTKIEGQKAKVSLAYIAPHGKWDAASKANGGDVWDYSGHNRVNPALVPGMYYVKQINDTEWLGLATYTRFGNMCQFERNSIVGTNAFSSRLNGVSVGVNYAKKLNKKLSASLGAEVNYVGLTLDKNLSGATGLQEAMNKPSSPEVSAIVSGLREDPNVMNAVGEAGAKLQEGKGDTPFHVKGESYALGWNAALNYEFDDKNEFGVVYRSKVKHSMEADYDIHGLGGAINNALYGTNVGEAYGSVTLPESWMLGYGHKFNDKTRMELNATWTRWSRFDAFWMNVNPSVLMNNPIGGVKNWKDGWRYAIGIEHKLSDKYSLLAGIAHDERGIPDETGDFMVPTGERDTYSLGVQYHDKKQTVAASFGYMDVGDMNMSGHGGSDAYKKARMHDSYTKIVVLSYQYNF